MTNVIPLCCKNKRENTSRLSAFSVFTKCRNAWTEMALSSSTLKLTLKLDLVVRTTALRSSSASKIRCKASLYVTVKGQWERSTTFTAKLHCIGGITLSHTIYRRIARTDSPNTLALYIATLWTRGVGLVFCNYDCDTAHPELTRLPRADPVWAARLKTMIRRHLIVTECTVKLSTGSSVPLMHREKAATFNVRPKSTSALILPHTHTK